MGAAMKDVDVVVIGAGAAGLGAAHRLIKNGVDTILLEGQKRIGGRALTVSAPTGEPLDLGCFWLHSARKNPFLDMACQSGFSINKKTADWDCRVANYFGNDKNLDWIKVKTAFYRRLHDAAITEIDDRPASDFLEGSRWDALLNMSSTWGNGVELDRLSIKDYENYIDTGEDWSLPSGYGTLVESYGKNLPIELDVEVLKIDHSSKKIEIDTSRGKIISNKVIVTVSTNVLVNEKMSFHPQITNKIEVASKLLLGIAEKIFLYHGSPMHGMEDKHFQGSITASRTGSYQLYPHGLPVIIGYFGGELARELEKLGLSGMSQFALHELAGLFGANFCKSLTPIVNSKWARDPWTRGSFSYAVPGYATNRRTWECRRTIVFSLLARHATKSFSAPHMERCLAVGKPQTRFWRNEKEIPERLFLALP
jgi:monoamine oxidase